tara:strand:+ start:486 stop:830 length:345 start_codon:yes stop_codon:yes gene_type:complete
VIRIKGGKKHHKEIALETAEWCIDHFRLGDVAINFRLDEKYKDCWGYCVEGNKEHSYNIKIVTDQILRDFVATIVHEMIHVNQWETGKWKGEGEREANKLQYKLTDKLWKEGII